METIISFTVLLLALIYVLRTYFPDFWDVLVCIAEVALESNHNSSSQFSDDDILADSPSRGLWDESSMYYSAMHDLNND